MRKTIAFCWMVAATAGCSADSPNEPPRIAERVHVIDDARAEKVQVTTGRLIFERAGNEDLLGLKEGDVLVAKRGRPDNGVGQGFLRKVKSVAAEDDQLVVVTDLAAVAGDLLIRGRAASSVQAQLGATWDRRESIPGLRSCDVDGLVGGELEFTGEALECSSGALSARVSRGSLQFEPDVHVELEVESGQLSKFEFTLDGDIGFELALQVQAEGSIIAKAKKKLFEHQYPLPPQFVGPVPIVEFVTLSLELECELTDSISASVELGVSGKGKVRGGARYSAGQWTPVNELEMDWAPIGPTIKAQADVELKCSLQPELSLMFYDVMGPYISAGPYLRGGAYGLPSSPRWSIGAGFEGHLGGKIEVLDMTLFDVNIKLFGLDVELAGGPLGGGAGAGGAAGGESGGAPGGGGIGASGSGGESGSAGLGGSSSATGGQSSGGAAGHGGEGGGSGAGGAGDYGGSPGSGGASSCTDECPWKGARRCESVTVQQLCAQVGECLGWVDSDCGTVHVCLDQSGCVQCGGMGQPCCEGATCPKSASLVCVSGKCQ